MDLNKLGSNVPLYTSDDNAKKFPIKSWRLVEVQQQLDFANYDLLVDTVKSWDSVSEYYIAIHDKDQKDGVPVSVHFHCYLKFNSPVPTYALLNKLNKGQDSDGTLDHTCFEFAQLNKIKGGWAAAIAYGSHLNAPEKYQYHSDPDFHPETNIGNLSDLQNDATSPIKNKRLRAINGFIAQGLVTRENLYVNKYVTVSDMVSFERQINAFLDFYEARRKRINQVFDDVENAYNMTMRYYQQYYDHNDSIAHFREQYNKFVDYRKDHAVTSSELDRANEWKEKVLEYQGYVRDDSNKFVKFYRDYLKCVDSLRAFDPDVLAEGGYNIASIKLFDDSVINLYESIISASVKK